MRNRASLIGIVDSDIDNGISDQGNLWVRFALRTTERFGSPENEMVEESMVHNIAVFGKLAQSCLPILVKGAQVILEGSINYHKITDELNIPSTITHIQAHDIIVIKRPNPKSNEQNS